MVNILIFLYLKVDIYFIIGNLKAKEILPYSDLEVNNSHTGFKRKFINLNNMNE